MTTVTLDTNCADDPELVRLAQVAGFEIRATTVTALEAGSSNIRRNILGQGAIPEPFVLAETLLGVGIPGSADTLERLLNIISNGSFPCKNQRSNLSHGQKRQLRDAQILTAHIRDGRDMFVTKDSTGFISYGRRVLIEKEFATKIMTCDEFKKICQKASV